MRSLVAHARALACLLPLVAGATAAVAEIRKQVGEAGEIVATNVAPREKIPAGAPAAGNAAPAASVAAPAPIADLLVEASTKYGFDPALIRAVVHAESAFDTMAVSRKGARGLMQLMPSTAKSLGVRNVHDPGANLEAGVAYLRNLLTQHGGRMDLALAAYNAGPEAVARYGGVPPYEETRRYLERIRRSYGDDLDGGDWTGKIGGIRVAGFDGGGVPHFTNIQPRRILRPGGAPARAPGKAPAKGKGER